MNNNCYIHGFGVYAPERVLTNDDLSRIVDTNDEWISSRTGIKQRHILAEDEHASDAGCSAAKLALRNADIDASELTHVLVATTTPEYICPATATIVASKLGCGKVMALDFNAACSGFVYGLSLARGLLLAEPNATILLVCTEALTRRLNWQDRASCVLFGDGAGAIILRANAKGAIASVLDVVCHSDGKLKDLITIGGGTKQSYNMGEVISEEFFLQMQGREVFKHAVRNMASVCNEVLERNGYNINDVDVFVPHQANIRIIEAVGSRLPISPEKVFTNVHKYGNTSSASIPLALADAMEAKVIDQGQLVLVCGVGAGFTWGASLIKFM